MSVHRLLTAFVMVAPLTALAPMSTSAQGTSPGNVAVTALNPNSSTVAWTGVRGAMSYRVLRAVDPKSRGEELIKLGSGMTSFVDGGVLPGTTYFYQVVAVYRDGSEGASPVVQFQAPAPAIAMARAGPVRVAPPQFSGNMLPLVPVSVGPARGTVLAAFDKSMKCDPAQPGAGPAPISFSAYDHRPGGATFYWPEVPGAVAYVVERAVDGTTNWSLAGSSCGSPDDLRRWSDGHGGTNIAFEDISGGIVPNTAYVYRVKAFGPAGEMGWNTTRWTAPAPWTPGFSAVSANGSTASFALNLQFSAPANEYLLVCDDGRQWTGNAMMQQMPWIQVYGLSVGTHTFTVTTLWVQTLDPKLPRVLTTSSAQTTITIKI